MTDVAVERRPDVEQRARSHHVAELLFRFRELGIALALLLVIGLTTIVNTNFVSGTSLQQLLAGASIITLLSIGETIVIVTRNVDLSIGSILGLTAYAVGVLFRDHPGIPIPLVFLVAIAIGALCGVVNGAITTVVRVPSLVVTLGTLYVIRGIVAAWAG